MLERIGDGEFVTLLEAAYSQAAHQSCSILPNRAF